MKTLEEHNKEMTKLAFQPQEIKAGVACNECGSELYYTDNAVLCSYPPQRNVHCKQCGKHSHMVGA